MSKEVLEPVTETTEAPWIMDDGGSGDRKFIMDDGEQPAEAPPAPPAAAAPGALPGQGYEYTTGTGHTFRGATADDVLKQMEAAVVRSATLAATSQEEINRARASIPAQTTYERGGTAKTPEVEPFDPQTYYKLLADTKPMEANEYMLKHYFGIENPKEALTTSYSVSQKVQDRFEVADFMSNNLDFPASPQAAEVLLRRIDTEGVPLNRWNLETAKMQLYREGVIQPVLAAPAPQAQPLAPAPQSRGAAAPPAPRNGSAFDPGERELTEAELNLLPIEEHKAHLRKKGYAV